MTPATISSQIRQIVSLLMLLLISVQIKSQTRVEPDSVRHTQTEAEFDSLRQALRQMKRDIDALRQAVDSSHSEMNQLISIFDPNETIDEDFQSRSRRGRVDALLQAITKQPGRLQFNGGATSIYQNSRNRRNYHNTFTGSFDIYAHTAFSPNSLLFFDLEAIGGNGPDQYYPNLAGANGDAGSTQSSDGTDRLTILEAWTEFTMLNKAITITAGKIDLTNYFDNNSSANDETMQFISGSFINSAAFAVPANSPGVRLRTTLLNKYHFQFGVSSSDNSGDEIFHDIYRIGSLGWTVLPGTGFESNLRIYGYQHPLANHGCGWGVSFDKIMFNDYHIFGRYGQNEDNVAQLWGVKQAWSAGTRFVKTIANQTLAIGLAYGENFPYNDQIAKEQVAELYFRRQVNQWIHISPHVQGIRNANGIEEDVLIFAVRTHFNF
ncbi:carbohydrate porin [Marinilabilia salmonicolor]|uniref:Carbohydrate-selective porin (OprB family) n=1 Tax=Marinilabilia salmonicolor TaxID=989 RepID=A0A368VCN4_9BACT|nr:carbohydrate porin [Marinilabilia salmonicolor]RCW38949.1 carbohydrate-selective porin (OprB family) [Marinilabilia salmonicolor]